MEYKFPSKRHPGKCSNAQNFGQSYTFLTKKMKIGSGNRLAIGFASPNWCLPK